MGILLHLMAGGYRGAKSVVKTKITQAVTGGAQSQRTPADASMPGQPQRPPKSEGPATLAPRIGRISLEEARADVYGRAASRPQTSPAQTPQPAEEAGRQDRPKRIGRISLEEARADVRARAAKRPFVYVPPGKPKTAPQRPRVTFPPGSQADQMAKMMRNELAVRTMSQKNHCGGGFGGGFGHSMGGGFGHSMGHGLQHHMQHMQHMHHMQQMQHLQHSSMQTSQVVANALMQQQLAKKVSDAAATAKPAADAAAQAAASPRTDR